MLESDPATTLFYSFSLGPSPGLLDSQPRLALDFLLNSFRFAAHELLLEGLGYRNL
jgi:hypothetical protein